MQAQEAPQARPVSTTSRRLKRVGPTRGPRMLALDLLALISTIWVIIIHSYNFAFIWMEFEFDAAARPESNLWYQFVANGTFSVDNFFLLAGFLARRHHGSTQTIGHQLARRIWNRYARLAPTMMLTIFLAILVFGSIECPGPNWPKSTLMFNEWCSSNASWLLNLLMAHNLMGTETMCLSHSWYLAVDFQLFVAFQLTCWLFKLAPSAQWNLMCTLIIGCCQLGTSFAVYRFDLPPVPLLPTRSESAMNAFYKTLYIKPHYWASSYFIGVLLAHNFQRIKRLTVKRARLLVCVNLMACVTLIHSNFFFFHNSTPMSRQFATIYALLARPAWSLNVASLLVLSNRLMCKLALPKSSLVRLRRLSLATYLLHPLLMAAFYGTRTHKFHFSHYLLLYFTIGNICLTFFGAFILHSLIELPCHRLLTMGWQRQPDAVDTSGLGTGVTRRFRSLSDGRPLRANVRSA